MPTISRFFGITITMFFDDHPPPHEHARYNQHRARFDIRSGATISGRLPPRATRLVEEWIALRRPDLEANWSRMEPGMSEVLVRRLKHLGGYRFQVEFTDGRVGEWDYSRIKSRLGPMAAPLHDEAYVAKAFLEDGAPTWPNGWDVSPEALLAELEAAGALKRPEPAK